MDLEFLKYERNLNYISKFGYKFDRLALLARLICF